MDLSAIDLKQFDDVRHKCPDDPTVDYSIAVLSAEKIAGDLIQRSAYRQLKDLQRVDNDDDFPYVYNPERTQQVIQFSTILQDPDSREPFVLSPYQMFIVGLLEGWIGKCQCFAEEVIDNKKMTLLINLGRVVFVSK